MIHPVRITPPGARPVQIEEARDQCRVTHFEQDSLLQSYIDAAVEHLDGWGGLLGRCMISQGWRQSFDGWSACLVIPMPGITDLSVRYLADDLTESAVAASEYQVVRDATTTTIVFRSGFQRPTIADDVRSVWVDFTAGYGPDPAAVPVALRTAIRMHVQALYDGLPDEDWLSAYHALIGPFRVRRV